MYHLVKEKKQNKEKDSQQYHDPSEDWDFKSTKQED